MTTRKKTTTTTDQDRHTIPLEHYRKQNNYFEKPKKSVPYPPRRGRHDTPVRNRKAAKSLLLVFPVELPDSFLEKLDCAETLTRFVAFHADLRGRLLRENGMAIKPCPNEWVFSALLAYEPVAEWTRRNRIDLSTGRHWLIFDGLLRRSYVADPKTAMRCLGRQALTRKPTPTTIDG